MKTLLLALVTAFTFGYTPTAEARDGDRHRRYYYRNHHHNNRVYYRSYPRQYYTYDYGYRYPYRVYPRRYYRPSGVSFFIRF